MAKVIATLREGLEPAAATESGKKKKGTAGKKGDATKTDAKSATKEGSSSKKTAQDDNTQFDNILPPEMPTSWVQCEACRKWRRVAWFVDSETLPELWECTMNTWDPENATCAAPQDGYDPDAENTLGFGTAEVPVDESAFAVGKKFDLYCNRNKVYYEASVLKIKKNPKRPNEPPKALFRFIGWGSRFDELVPINSDRIAPHNLHTNPASRNPRDQEKWQGAKNLFGDQKAIIRSAFIMQKKKGTGDDHPAENTGTSKRRRGAAENNVSSADADAGKAAATATKAAAGAKKNSKTASAKAAATVSPAYCDDFEDLCADANDEGAAECSGGVNVSMDSTSGEGFPISGLWEEGASPSKKTRV